MFVKGQEVHYLPTLRKRQSQHVSAGQSEQGDKHCSRLLGRVLHHRIAEEGEEEGGYSQRGSRLESHKYLVEVEKEEQEEASELNRMQILLSLKGEEVEEAVEGYRRLSPQCPR